MRLTAITLASIATLLSVAGARAQDRQAAPKIAVVVAGDPDDELRATARELEAAISETGELRVPSDPGLRAALRGEPTGGEDDGLERVRAERRRVVLPDLENTTASDLRPLRALGRTSGAVAVVVVRRAESSAIEALVMDVGRMALYEGEVTVSDLEATRSFVTTRARSAMRAAERGEGPAAAQETPPDGPATAPSATPVPDDGGEEDDGIFSEWPLVVAGALLVGFLLFFVLDDDPAEQGPPVLRFSTGGR